MKITIEVDQLIPVAVPFTAKLGDTLVVVNGMCFGLTPTSRKCQDVVSVKHTTISDAEIMEAIKLHGPITARSLSTLLDLAPGAGKSGISRLLKTRKIISTTSSRFPPYVVDEKT